VFTAATNRGEWSYQIPVVFNKYQKTLSSPNCVLFTEYNEQPTLHIFGDGAHLQNQCVSTFRRTRNLSLVKPCINRAPISCFAIRSPQDALRQMPYGKSNGSHLNHTAYCAGRYSRISSKYIVPEPPACGLFLSPNPRAIVLTLARFTPCSANACRSIFHSVHSSIWAAFGLS